MERTNKYATFGSDGLLLCRLDSRVNEIPDDAIAVDESLWRRMVQEDDGGWFLVDGQIVKKNTPPQTAEQVFTGNKSTLEQLLASASQAMTPLLVSLQLGNATDAEKTLASAWQKYYRGLKAVDLTVKYPQWPEPPNDQ